MEPVPVTRRVRRTVRMAVALVVGQALLCALIGWLTLGASQPAKRGDTRALDQLDQLAPPPPRRPLPIETTSAAPSPSPSPTRAAVVRTTRPDRVTPPRRTRTTLPAPPPPPTAASSKIPARPTPTSPPATPPSPSPGPVLITIDPRPPAPPSVAPTPPLQQPVTLGERCRPEGAYGRTARGTLARCVRDGHHRPRWKIV